MVKSQGASRYLILMLLVSYLCIPIGVVLGAQTNWITLVSVTDNTSKTPVPVGQPLLTGHSYNVTIQIDVPFTQSGSNFNVVLDTGMASTGTQFWYLLTKNYGGYDSTTFKPGEKSILFKQVEGKIQLAMLFSVPTDFTVKQALGVTYRFLQKDFPIVKVSVTGGSIVGVQNLDVSDASIQNYLTTLNQKQDLIPKGLIDSSYDSLVKGVFAQANVIYKLGLPEQATDMLNVISTSNFPAPPNNGLQTILMGAVAVMAIVAVIAFIMFSRASSKVSMKTSAIDDTRNELASLEVTAARYDDSLAGQLKKLRDKLEEA